MTNEIEERIGYSFKSKALLESAMHHSSIKKYALQFERLEFLGDRVLGIVVAEYIFSTFNVEEGVMSRMFSAFVCASSCKDVALKIGLDKYLVTASSSLATNETVLADTMESVIGAVFVDGGYEASKMIILRGWDEIFKGYDDINYDPKTKLQELCQRKTGATPQYDVISITGLDHCPIVTVSVAIGSESVTATGSSRKKAETLAARLLLEKIGIPT
ncbi:MAG: ribonuclease III [Holosporales bacterium]|jgi:ribonuclease-3|nr:ribonuclease III [Holosporales bacterium]